MGLIARKDFVGENGRQYKNGEPCDEALNWRYPALRACLNFGIIEDQTGEVSRKFNIHTRELTDADRDSMVARRVEKGMRQRAKDRAMKAARKACVEAGQLFDAKQFEADYVEDERRDEPSLEAVQAQADMVRKNSGVAAPVLAVSAPVDRNDLVLEPQHGCPHCEKVFGSEHALRIHHGKAHRE